MNMNEMKDEAIKRMKKLKLMKEVIKAYKEGGDNSLYYSERINKMMPAVLYWVDNKDEYVKAVKDFENKYGGLVYHCILTHTLLGDLLDMLYVCKEKNEWQQDNIDLMDNYVFAYSYNLDENEGEFGTIAVRPVMGGLERIG